LARNVDRAQRGPAGAAPRSGGAQQSALAIKLGGLSGPPRPPAASNARTSWVLARGAAMGVAALLAFSPQLLAYRALTGRFGPSRLVARKMSWSSPHLLQVLFDPGHGLFAWSPLLLLATAGLLFLVGRRRDLTTVLLALCLLAQVWINGAVESWTQAG